MNKIARIQIIVFFQQRVILIFESRNEDLTFETDFPNRIKQTQQSFFKQIFLTNLSNKFQILMPAKPDDYKIEI